jgi:hypothetical protein
MLARLIYHSENHLGGVSGKMFADLNSIKDIACLNNKMAGITGALLFDALWFIQILEGDREELSKTLHRIALDDRQQKLTVMDVRPIDKRLFANSWIGIALLNDDVELYTRLGLRARFDPRTMTGDQAVMLALELAKPGLNRELAQ